MFECVDPTVAARSQAVVLAGFAGALGVGLHDLIAQDAGLEPVMAETSSLTMAIEHFEAAVAFVNVDAISHPVQLRALVLGAPHVGFVVAVAHPSRTRDDRLLAAGARAVLPLTVDAVELRAVLRLVARGLVGGAPSSRSGRRGGIADLTARETEVVDLLLRRRTAREIAEALYISTTTVNSHRRRIYEKLGVHSRSELHASLVEPARDAARGMSTHPR